MLVGCMIKSTEWEQFDWFQSSSLCSLLVMRRAFMHKWFHNVPHRKCEFHVAIKTTYVIQRKCPVLCLSELTNDERLIIKKDFSSADSHYDHCYETLPSKTTYVVHESNESLPSWLHQQGVEVESVKLHMTSLSTNHYHLTPSPFQWPVSYHDTISKHPQGHG